MTLKEIALELLYKYENAEQIVIDEYSGDYFEEGKELRLEVERYKELIENAYCGVKTDGGEQDG